MTGSQGLGGLFRDGIFLRVWLTGVASGVARWLEMLVVGIFAFEVTGSPFLVALLVILRMIPLAAFGSVVGAFADRWPRRLVLAAGLALAALISGILFVLFWAGAAGYWHVALATFLSGVIWTTDMPFRRGILGDVAGGARIGAAMSLDSASNNANRMLGPLLGGVIYQAFGTGGAFALSMLLYGLAAALVLTVPAATAATVRTGPPTRVRRDLADAFRFVAGNSDVLRVLLVTVVFNLWAFPFVSMIPVIGHAELDLSAAGIGVLSALEGGGAFLGAMMIAVWGRRPSPCASTWRALGWRTSSRSPSSPPRRRPRRCWPTTARTRRWCCAGASRRTRARPTVRRWRCSPVATTPLRPA